MNQLTGRIVAWDRQKRYGFVEADGRRVFLHIRDFAEVHKQPELGDEIVFTLGTDAKGRSCATQAVHRHDGGRLRPIHFTILALLLVAPALAGWRLVGAARFGYVAGVAAFASAVMYFLYADDKQRARARAWRAPEYILHLFEFAGGWPGAFLAQQRLRHKCSKFRYQFVFWLIVAVHQYVAVDYLLDWRIAHHVVESVHALSR
ncbi:DUF1294 domain-containing protein [Opitutus terrae]|uniref:Uncharacterized protein n=1 Tax=Opitutus terrae (strain DSM 11246 / JCM 15787 / PB90-1) TaxID=452637 RepID=B1ZML9_OPITP|nr:DUF1294 domain-containing protein [Opitutus terrae]ACB74364.1 protein of unknown function DUF1294 [Opitutus terrae PB90-1]